MQNFFKMDHTLVKLTCFTLPLWIALLISEPGPAGCSSGDQRKLQLQLPQKTQSVDLYFPTPVLEGNDLTMNCRFKVDQNSSIYQVKWYKGSREIFRFQPKEFPPKKVMALPTLIIDEDQSDMNKLVLRKVPMALRGNVSCEVTWEPSFTTITKTGQLLVVSAPQERPSLTVEFNPPTRAVSRTGVATMMVQKNDTLTATCTSGASSPAVNITFYINNENYNTRSLGVLERKQEVIEFENKTDFRTLRSTLRLKLTYGHFVRNRIRVRCEATLFNLYNSTSDEYEAEVFRETLLQSSSYGGIYGKNGGAASARTFVGCGGVRGSLTFGRLVWSFATIGAGQLVLFVVTWATSWTL